MNDIIDSIGLPAVLEQLAEECSELAQAALKYSRVLRGENPTPKTEQECLDAVIEETADVELCISVLTLADAIPYDLTVDILEQKSDRWKNRIREAHHEEHKPENGCGTIKEVTA